MSDADCTPGREPRSVAASFVLKPIKYSVRSKNWLTWRIIFIVIVILFVDNRYPEKMISAFLHACSKDYFSSDVVLLIVTLNVIDDYYLRRYLYSPLFYKSEVAF